MRRSPRGPIGGRNPGRPAPISKRCVANCSIRSGRKFAICNCVYGAQVLHNEDMAAALCRAVNDWIAREWLDREPRLRASIVVPVQNPQLAVEEIERRAEDKRFVQVLLPVDGRDDARAAHLLADLRGGRASRARDRDPRGLELSLCAELDRLVVVSA